MPNSFCQKITNPNCKHIKAVQITLVWLSISPIFYEQLFHTKVLCTAIMCLQFGFVIFWRKEFGAKAAHKMLVKLTPGWMKMVHFENKCALAFISLTFVHAKWMKSKPTFVQTFNKIRQNEMKVQNLLVFTKFHTVLSRSLMKSFTLYKFRRHLCKSKRDVN